MGRIAYVNGRFVPHGDAMVHIEDRGYQFADGVYEVYAVRGGRLLDEEGHFARLERSLGELSMACDLSRKSLQLISRELLRRNRVIDGVLYLQITRGVAPRDHAFPVGVRCSIIMTAKAYDYAKAEERARAGVAVRTFPDLRWARRDIKSVSLLPNVLAKQAARMAGAYEAWLVDEDGFITEGASSNAWIVDDRGVLVTRSLGPSILTGTIRQMLKQIALEHQIRIEERPFSIAEAKAAREAFMTAASAFVTPVVRVDQTVIGDGRPGQLSLKLRAAYLSKALT